MGVAGRGQPGAYVKELPDARLADQVADGAAEELPLRAHAGQHRRIGRDHYLGRLTVGCEVVARLNERIYPVQAS